MTEQAVIGTSPRSLERDTVGDTGHTDFVFIIFQVNEPAIGAGELIEFRNMGPW